MIPSKEAMDALIHYAKERDKITGKWATIKTMRRELNIATVEARCTGAGVPVGVTTDALIAALDRDFVWDKDPVLLEDIGWVWNNMTCSFVLWVGPFGCVLFSNLNNYTAYEVDN